MDRGDLHYYDCRDTKSGERMRVILTLPGLGSITPATTPAWGAAAETDWAQLGYSEGDGTDYAVMTIPVVGEASFEAGLGIGLSKTPTATMTFFMDRLTEIGATNLRDDLITVGVSGSGLPITSAMANVPTNEITTQPAPVLTLLSDKGDSAATIGQFSVVFQGVQQKFPSRTLRLSYKKNRCEYEVQFLHIGRYCAMQVTPENIAQYILYNYNTTTYVGGNASENYAYSFFYENIWTNGSTVYGICSGVRGNSGDRVAARLLRADTLCLAIATLLQQVYRVLLRNPSATFQLAKGLGSESYGGNGTPFDFLQWYRRDLAYDETNTWDGSPQTSELYYIAAGWDDETDTVSINSDALGTKYEAGEIAFGLLSSADQYGIHTYANCYDLLVDLTGGGICSGIFLNDPTSGTTQWLDMLLVFSALGNPFPSSVNIKRDDIYGEEVEAELGAGIVREVQVGIPDATGDDVSPVAVQATDAGLADTDMGVGLFFHNAPYLGSIDEFRAMLHGHSAGLQNPDFADSGTYMCGVIDTISPRRLYFFDDASTLMNYDVPIAAQPGGIITTGFAHLTESYGTTVALPTPQFIPGFTLNGKLQGVDDWFKSNFFERYRDVVYVLQRQAGLGYGASLLLQVIFSNKHQWRIHVDISSRNGGLEKLSGKFRLTDESNNPAAFDIFLQNGSYVTNATYPSHGHCVAVSVADGFASLTLVGVPT